MEIFSHFILTVISHKLPRGFLKILLVTYDNLP